MSGGDLHISILMYKQRFKAPNLKSTRSKNYAHIRYIATRPRVMRVEGKNHGLFGRLEPGEIEGFEDWREVARHVYRLSAQGVTMYRGIVSFKREVAGELSLSDQKDWQRYVEKHILTVARENGIKTQDLGWACAAHDEKGHPHAHIMFWDESARIKNPFTHPSIPDKIRKQMIRDTFADKIMAYGQAKDLAVASIREVSDSMVDDFEQSVRLLSGKEYAELAAKYESEDEQSEGFTASDEVIGGMADRLFRIKAGIPQKGRIAYKLLPPEVKAQVDELVDYLLQNSPQLKDLCDTYVVRKLDMVRLYNDKPETLDKAESDYRREIEKILANRLLGGVKRLFRLESEMRSAEFTRQRKQFYAEQLFYELLYLADRQASGAEDDYERMWLGGELSKEARKELYLRYQDKGYEH